MMRETKLASLLLVAVGGALAMSSPADASVSVALSMDDVAKGSSAVVRATPLDQTSAWENGRIVTSTRLHVDKVVAGEAPSSAEIHVRTLGGIVGDIGQIVEGEAQFNNAAKIPCLIFLLPQGDRAHFVVNGRAQGQLLFSKDVKTSKEIVRIVKAGALLPRRTQITTPVAALDGRDADEVTNEAKSAWERTHASR